MQALKIICALITGVALGISSAWAQDENSLDASAELSSFKVIPPLLSSATGTIELTFVGSASPTEGTPITEEVVAQALQEGNARARITWPRNQLRGIDNIRLYFGQYFANGRPVATLCDDTIPSMECDCTSVEENGVEDNFCISVDKEFKFSDIQFQPAQTFSAGNELIDEDRRLYVDEMGFNVLNDLIKRGLIYVVVNSEYTAKLNPATGHIDYTAPEASIIDGDLRGTLRLASQTEVLRRLHELSNFLGL